MFRFLYISIPSRSSSLLPVPLTALLHFSSVLSLFFLLFIFVHSFFFRSCSYPLAPLLSSLLLPFPLLPLFHSSTVFPPQSLSVSLIICIRVSFLFLQSCSAPSYRLIPSYSSSLLPLPLISVFHSSPLPPLQPFLCLRPPLVSPTPHNSFVFHCDFHSCVPASVFSFI